MGGIAEVGSFLVDPLGIGYGDAIHGVKKDKDKSSGPAPQQAKAATSVDSSAGLAKADPNQAIIKKQGDKRRQLLLNQSTGRPQGPTISTQPTNRSLF